MTQEQRIWDELIAHGPKSGPDIAAATGIGYFSVAGAVARMMAKGCLTHTGSRKRGWYIAVGKRPEDSRGKHGKQALSRGIRSQVRQAASGVPRL